MQKNRRCGAVLHPTSLPGAGGIGTLGEDARRFIDLLAGMGMSCWQVLPLNPTASGNSPYSAFSAFAGNPLLIDLDTLSREGDVPMPAFTMPSATDRVDYGALLTDKIDALHGAAAAFFAAGRTARMEEFWHFCDTTPWLHDYALFMALKQRYKGKCWNQWPASVALPDDETYARVSVELGPEIGTQKYMQWQFSRQWGHLRAYAAAQGISIIGDIPIFVAYDSADVWRNRGLFLLDERGRPTVVAGVPPDYFSNTGQLWGNPLYDWDALEKRGYDWWIERFRFMFSQFDCIRIDHFRGFDAAWHVPAGHKTAIKGAWVAGPGRRLFDALFSALGPLPIIAEDLGEITPQVEALRDHYGFPGMKILHFAFGSGPSNSYLPHNHINNCVVYTGTHDNDTSAGWFQALDDRVQREVLDYLGSAGGNPVNDLVRAAFVSVADTAIIPFQDVLGLPTTARMNMPGTSEGNWEWRFSWDLVDKGLAARFRHMLEIYGRCQHLSI
ncbi:MAG: 4-alpha-glucanotransferase [Geobacteraceae bacterium]|nr:4-alpha-glucanotransferase [Geobacteraceae bacterium]